MNVKLRVLSSIFLAIVLILFISLQRIVRIPPLRRETFRSDIVNNLRVEYGWTTLENSNKIADDGYIYFNAEQHRKYVSSPNITRIIHQSWKTKDVPEFFKRYHSSWKKCFPNWEHKFWTDEENRNEIAAHHRWFLQKYDSLTQSIYKADCARYAYMLHYGGLYTDLDNECLFPFEHLLANHSLVFGTIDHVPTQTPLEENYVQNSFMYSRPNHPFWTELLLNITNTNITSTADISTGPVALSNMIDRYRTRYPYTHNIKIYAAMYFNPITWGEQNKNPAFCKIWNGMTDEEYKQCHEYYLRKGSYVVQYHSHVWGSHFE